MAGSIASMILIATHHSRSLMSSLLRCSPASSLGLLSLTAVLSLAGCQAPLPTVDAPPPKMEQTFQQVPVGDSPENMLDWPGTYQAVLPQRAISVQLRDDRTAVVRERSLDTTGEPVNFTYQGPFRFDPAGGSLITLSESPEAQPAYRFFVGENWIELRDRASGAPLPQEQHFRLKKTSLPPQ